MGERHDVAILGGGLAGLTLALQLKRTRPETSVLVLEKREGPAPLAAFKVGESTLEIAGHYFADVCGLRDHLDDAHLWKLGLRYYFPAGDNRDIARRVEWGPPAPRREIPFRIKTYQIDRGVFENELADRCRAIGVDLRRRQPRPGRRARRGRRRPPHHASAPRATSRRPRPAGSSAPPAGPPS